jgi:hypothetical protein
MFVENLSDTWVKKTQVQHHAFRIAFAVELDHTALRWILIWVALLFTGPELASSLIYILL